jgi:hypothetical protein
LDTRCHTQVRHLRHKKGYDSMTNGKIEFSPFEKQLIDQWRRTLATSVQLTLLLNGDERSEPLQLFSERLKQEAPEVAVQVNQDETVVMPALAPRASLRLHGVPSGKELSPFLELLSVSAGTPADFSSAIRAKIDQVTLPADLKLYIMPQCPFCPKMVRDLGRLACRCDLVDLAIVDGLFFQDEARRDNIQSAPTLILEDQWRWSGLTGLSEVLDAIMNRDSFRLGISSLKKMLTQGRAQELAEMMLSDNMLFPAYIDLLTDKKWPVRLGAMVALEYLAESDRALSQKVIDPISGRFHRLNDTVKGDVLYLFGLVGDEKMLPQITDILSKEANGPVKESAQEAIDAIRSRKR